MPILANQVDCSTTRKGVGLPDCIIQEGMPKGFIAVEKGWSVLLADSFNKTYIQNEVLIEEFVPFTGCFNFADNTPESTIEESQNGVKYVVRNGLPEFTFTFKKGYAFHSASYSYNSNQSYDYLLVFASGAIMGCYSADGLSMKGFDGGMLNTSSYKFNDGSASASTGVMFQLLSDREFNQDGLLIASSNLDINVNTELFGIADVLITGTADVSDAKITATVKFKANPAIVLTGASASNFGLTVSGVDDAVSGTVTESPAGTYAITPTATLTTSTPVVVRMRKLTTNVAQIGNKFYKGQSASITPTA